MTNVLEPMTTLFHLLLSTLVLGPDPADVAVGILEPRILEYYFARGKPPQTVKDLWVDGLLPMSSVIEADSERLTDVTFAGPPRKEAGVYWRFSVNFSHGGKQHKTAFTVPLVTPDRLWYIRYQLIKGEFGRDLVETPENQAHFIADAVECNLRKYPPYPTEPKDVLQPGSWDYDTYMRQKRKHQFKLALKKVGTGRYSLVITHLATGTRYGYHLPSPYTTERQFVKVKKASRR